MSIIDRPSHKPAHKMPANPKPALDLVRVPVFRVHYTKLEAFIQRVFGFEFDFLMAAGITAGMVIELDVNGELPSISWDRRANDLRAGRRTKDIVLIMAVLCRDGYIPAGRYTVRTQSLPDPTTVYTQLLNETGDPDSDRCRAYRKSYLNDPIFRARADILDAAVREAKAK